MEYVALENAVSDIVAKSIPAVWEKIYDGEPYNAIGQNIYNINNVNFAKYDMIYFAETSIPVYGGSDSYLYASLGIKKSKTESSIGAYVFPTYSGTDGGYCIVNYLKETGIISNPDTYQRVSPFFNMTKVYGMRISC